MASCFNLRARQLRAAHVADAEADADADEETDEEADEETDAAFGHESCERARRASCSSHAA